MATILCGFQPLVDTKVVMTCHEMIELRKRGIVNLLAGVAFSEREDEYLTDDSKEFHIRKGYSQVAHMKSVGKKFDRWYDLLWFQKKIY